MSPLLTSLLFVPGDSERKQIKALTTAADALILDLEDSVAAAQLPAARLRVRELLTSQKERSQQQLWVRVNSPSSGQLMEDVTAVFAGAPDGLLLPKISSAEEIIEVAHVLEALEVRDRRPIGCTRLMVIATETPQAVLNLPGYAERLAQVPEVLQRVTALTWGSEDLSAALGAASKIDAQGALTFTFQLARSLTLLAATALGVQAIDGVFVDFRNGQGLAQEARVARRDGFAGKLAIHPDQVDAINSAFSPSESELARARRIVAAFAASPHAGVLTLEGEMIDRPHLIQARRLLDRVARRARTD